MPALAGNLRAFAAHSGRPREPANLGAGFSRLVVDGSLKSEASRNCSVWSLPRAVPTPVTHRVGSLWKLRWRRGGPGWEPDSAPTPEPSSDTRSALISQLPPGAFLRTTNSSVTTAQPAPSRIPGSRSLLVMRDATMWKPQNWTVFDYAEAARHSSNRNTPGPGRLGMRVFLEGGGENLATVALWVTTRRIRGHDPGQKWQSESCAAHTRLAGELPLFGSRAAMTLSVLFLLLLIKSWSVSISHDIIKARRAG